MNCLDSNENLLRKYSYYCLPPEEFLEAVDRERGREDMDQFSLGQGGTGQRLTKSEVSRISMEELEGGAGTGKGSAGGPGTGCSVRKFGV